MSHWQLRLQRKLLSSKFWVEPNSLSKAFLISFVVHVFIFIVPFLFIRNSGIIIIDSTGKYNIPVYYKLAANSGRAGSGANYNFNSGNSSGSFKNAGLTVNSKNSNKTNKSGKNNIASKLVSPQANKNSHARQSLAASARAEDTGAFVKLKKFSRKQNFSKSTSKKNNKLDKKTKNKLDNKNNKNLKNSSKKLTQPEIKPETAQEVAQETVVEEKVSEKINAPEILENNNTQESNSSSVPLPENLGTLDFSGNNSGDSTAVGTGFGIEGYLHSDGELVDGIRNAVGKNWSRPKGFTSDVYCEFKILVAQDGKSVKILEQKDSKVPAFNIQARGAILRTEFPEKCWNKELNLILR